MVCIKQVKKSTKSDSTGKNFYLTIYSYIKEHSSVSALPLILDLKTRQSLNYYLNHLKMAGLIKKIGYGVWKTISGFSDEKIKTSKKLTTKVDSNNQDRIRGHAFQFRVKLPDIPNWKKRRVFLEKNNISYRPLQVIGMAERIFLKGRKIWLTDNSIIIYEKTSFIADSARDSRNYAIYTMLGLLHNLEALLSISCRINKRYIFTVNKQHYSKLRCELAKQYRKDGKKLYVKDHRGYWLWADYSLNVDETETGNQKESHEDMDNHIHPFLNSLRNIKGYTPEFVTGCLGKLAEDREYYAENQKMHVSVIEKLGKNTDILGKEIKKLSSEIIRIGSIFSGRNKADNRLESIKHKIMSMDDVFLYSGEISGLSIREKDDLADWLFKKFGGED